MSERKREETTRHPGLAVLVVVVSVGLTLLGAEAVFRLIDYPFRPTWTPSENALARFDKDLGWSYLPDHSGTVQPFGDEASAVPVRFDRHGSRVRAEGDERDPERPSVLLVGGSVTMGHGLVYDETFAGRLEAREDFPLQPVNLGVQAFGTDQALLMLERHLGTFDTRAVVYTYVSDHVVRNSVADRRYLYRGARVLGTKPLFRLGRDERLEQVGTPVRARKLKYSRVAAALRLAEIRLLPPPGPELTRALMLRMREVAESRGAAFVVVRVVQSPPMSAPGPPVFERTDLDVIDTTVNAPAGWDDWVIPGDGHPDARANARIAELIVERLRERGALDGVASESR
jgi:hypothetical protein